MTRTRKIGKLLLLFLIVTGFSSCLDDDGEAPFSFIGEAITVKRMIDFEVVYAPAFYAYGNQPMKSASVTTAGGSVVPLILTDTNNRTWYFEPSLDDFTAQRPMTGQYTFDVVHEDIPHNGTDVLSTKNLGFPEITILTAENGGIVLEWNQVTGANQYKVIVKNDANEVLYSSPLLESAAKKFIVNASSGLNKVLESGEIYTVELLAYVYEDNITSENYLYNIEEISITSVDVEMDGEGS